MIRPGNDGAPVYLHVAPVDFRKQINGLAALVENELDMDAFSPAVFAFTNRRRNAVKLLAWERNGFVLWLKKLERDRFHWPRAVSGDGSVATMSAQELNWLLDGIDLRHFKPHQVLNYQYAA